MIKLSRLLLTSVVTSLEKKFKFSSQYPYIIQQTGKEDRQLNVSAAGFNLGKTPDSHDYFQRNVEQVEARIASQIVGVNVKCSVRRKRLPSQQCCDKMVLCLK